MKAKTILELMVLSSNLYMLSQDKELMGKLKEMAEKGKDKFNDTFGGEYVDEDGNRVELIDRLREKAGQAKDELEEKVSEMVANFYKKVNIAHLDEIRALKEQLKESDKAIALLEARLNRLEQNEG